MYQISWSQIEILSVSLQILALSILLELVMALGALRWAEVSCVHAPMAARLTMEGQRGPLATSAVDRSRFRIWPESVLS
jgi:hypothetical protein